jgi:ABC-type glycerol-3-phosphate transport system substrate-binding protein
MRQTIDWANPSLAPAGGCKRSRHGVTAMAIRALVAVTLLLSGCAPLLPSSAPDRQIVVLWHTFTGSEAQALETLTDRFNAENPWQILLITEYQEQLLRKLREVPEGRPDLVTVWPEDLQTYVALDMVGAAPTLSSEMRAAWDDLLPMARSLYVSEGVPQALPLGLATYLAYYNTEWLGDLGYDASTASWEEFRRTVCAATDPLRGRIGVGVPARASILLAFLSASGSAVVGEDGYYQFSDEEGRAAAALLQAVMAGDCGVVYQDWDKGPAQLSNSSMAVVVESSQRLADVERAILEGRNFPLGISPLPGLAGPGATLWYGPGLMVSTPEGSRQTAALQVLSWFFSPEAQSYWGEMTDYVPVRRSVIESALVETESATATATETSLLQLTLAAADSESWVVWPPATDRMACRASLLRALLAFQSEEANTDAYIDTAVTACNTGVGFRLQPTATPTEEATP